MNFYTKMYMENYYDEWKKQIDVDAENEETVKLGGY